MASAPSSSPLPLISIRSRMNPMSLAHLGGVRKTVKAKLQNAAWLLSLFALHSKTLCIEVRPWYAQKNGIEQTRHPNRLSR